MIFFFAIRERKRDGREIERERVLHTHTTSRCLSRKNRRGRGGKGVSQAIERHGGAEVQGRASGDREERLPQCGVRELQGEGRPYPAGQAALGHRGTRRVSERERERRGQSGRGLSRKQRVGRGGVADEHWEVSRPRLQT